MARTRAIAAAAAIIVALAGCAQTGGSDDMSEMDHGSTSPSASTGAEFNDADVMFAAMMIPHHQQAVEMSAILLAKDGVDAEVADLARGIQDAQGPEIETMQGWLDDWGADASEHADMSGGGMLSEEQLAALEAADGPEASRLYVEQMIAHHEGAVAMAQDEVDAGRAPDAVALAERIVTTQTAEIERMQGMLDRL